MVARRPTPWWGYLLIGITLGMSAVGVVLYEPPLARLGSALGLAIGVTALAVSRPWR